MSDYDARQRWTSYVRNEPGLSVHVRIVGMAMVRFLNAEGIGTVGVADLMAEAGVSRATVKRATKVLDATGWLRRLDRGGYTPAGPRFAMWQLRTPEGFSRAHAEPFSEVNGRSQGLTESRSQEVSTALSEPLRPLKGSERAHEGVSRAHAEPLLLGGKDKDKESSSLGVSLTRGGSASLAGPAQNTVVIDPQAVDVVMQAIPEILRARVAVDTSGANQGSDNQRALVMERLANGVSVVQLIDDAYRVARDAQRVVQRGGSIDRPVSWYTKVMRNPPPPRVEDIAWCGNCDPNGEQDAAARWRELDGLMARCWECHPAEVTKRQQSLAALDRVMAS